MSTQDINTYLNRTNDVTITWLNDSSCTITYPTPEEARKVYSGCSLSDQNMENTELQIGEAMLVMSEDVDPRNFDPNTGWKEAFGFQLTKPPNNRYQKLWLRYACTSDVKSQETKGSNSRYYQLQKKLKEQKLKRMGLFQYKKPTRRGDPEDESDPLGNSQFLKKAIGKQQRPLGGRRRERKRSDSEDGESSSSLDNEPIVGAVETAIVQPELV